MKTLLYYHKHSHIKNIAFREREIGESETNIVNPKRTIYLTIKVTFSSSGYLLTLTLTLSLNRLMVANFL